MKNRKKMLEIILICVGGIITIGISVNSIIQSELKDNKLREKQDSLYNAQVEISRKSEIINQKSEMIIQL